MQKDIDTLTGQLLAIAGQAMPDRDRLSWSVGRRALASRFKAEQAVSAVLGATGTLAAELAVLSGGEPQHVAVDTRHATATLSGFAFQQIDGREQPLTGGRDGPVIAGFHRSRDGRWVYLHNSFPPNAERIAELLECPGELERVKAAVARWDADELESALAKRGLTGAIVRSPEQWDRHEQGRLLAAQPPVEVVRFADSPPEPLAGDQPLDGVRVLDLTRVLAGPTCARTLASHGAEVLKVNSPQLPFIQPFVIETGHGKRTCHLDLKDGRQLEQLKELARSTDVFSQGYRSGAMERLGLGPAALHELRPGVIYTAMNCYGHEGPMRINPGWEQLAQTVSGMAFLEGRLDGDGSEPRLQLAAVNDYITGYLAAFGTLVALQRRARFGGSYLVRASLTRTAMWIRAMGVLDDPEATADVALPDSAEVRNWSETRATEFGELTFLRPAIVMSATPPIWSLPPAPLGSHAPEWVERCTIHSRDN